LVGQWHHQRDPLKKDPIKTKKPVAFHVRKSGTPLLREGPARLFREAE
jgi:hypothetical protein